MPGFLVCDYTAARSFHIHRVPWRGEVPRAPMACDCRGGGAMGTAVFHGHSFFLFGESLIAGSMIP